VLWTRSQQTVNNPPGNSPDSPHQTSQKRLDNFGTAARFGWRKDRDFCIHLQPTRHPCQELPPNRCLMTVPRRIQTSPTSCVHCVCSFAGSEQRERISVNQPSGSSGSRDVIPCTVDPAVWCERSKSCRILYVGRPASSVRRLLCRSRSETQSAEGTRTVRGEDEFL